MLQHLDRPAADEIHAIVEVSLLDNMGARRVVFNVDERTDCLKCLPSDSTEQRVLLEVLEIEGLSLGHEIEDRASRSVIPAGFCYAGAWAARLQTRCKTYPTKKLTLATSTKRCHTT